MQLQLQRQLVHKGVISYRDSRLCHLKEVRSHGQDQDQMLGVSKQTNEHETQSELDKSCRYFCQLDEWVVHTRPAPAPPFVRSTDICLRYLAVQAQIHRSSRPCLHPVWSVDHEQQAKDENCHAAVEVLLQLRE